MILEFNHGCYGTVFICQFDNELIDTISEKDTLNLFEDIVKINKEIEQCKFVLGTENSAPC